MCTTDEVQYITEFTQQWFKQVCAICCSHLQLSMLILWLSIGHLVQCISVQIRCKVWLSYISLVGVGLLTHIGSHGQPQTKCCKEIPQLCGSNHQQSPATYAHLSPCHLQQCDVSVGSHSRTDQRQTLSVCIREKQKWHFNRQCAVCIL